ncbi:hypothetical protein [Streptomyces griseorubiginosus]|nr:hypothetical protein [Streptomyces griseorubiginosus]
MGATLPVLALLADQREQRRATTAPTRGEPYDFIIADDGRRARQ